MKGFNEFLTSLLPSQIESGRIKFKKNLVESSLKHEDGSIIVQSNLETTNEALTGEVCVPHLSQLQKAYKALEEPTIGIQYEHDIAARLTLRGAQSKVSLFLMDPEFVAWPQLTREPDYTLSIELPDSVLASLKTNYSLVDSQRTTISLSGGTLTFKIGEETHENSATTSVPIDIDDEFQMAFKSDVIVAILDSINPDSEVVIHVSDHGLTKFTVVKKTDNYVLTAHYFLVATKE